MQEESQEQTYIDNRGTKKQNQKRANDRAMARVVERNSQSQ